MFNRKKVDVSLNLQLFDNFEQLMTELSMDKPEGTSLHFKETNCGEYLIVFLLPDYIDIERYYELKEEFCQLNKLNSMVLGLIRKP